MTASSEWASPGHGELDALCRTVFDSLPRSDQRRWAGHYVRGLVTVPDRKSIRRIAEQLPGRSAAQCLQQFVNQSPWEWAPVRAELARIATATISPRAWVVQEADFPKVGNHSVGVAQQYAPVPQSTGNLQLATTVWLAGDEGWVPANWRLMLPPCWDRSSPLRDKAHVPRAERHHPAWQHVVASVEEMIGSWDLTPRPVLGDRRHDNQVEPLANGLEERGIRYALRINEVTGLSTGGGGRIVRAGDLLGQATPGLVALPPSRNALWTCSAVVAATAAVPGPVPAPSTGPVGHRPRQVVAIWPRGRAHHCEIWLTNLPVTVALGHLTRLDVTSRGRRELTALRRWSGLDHFEGRSFRGWHHHVTLASVAHAYRVLHEIDSAVLDPVG